MKSADDLRTIDQNRKRFRVGRLKSGNLRSAGSGRLDLPRKTTWISIRLASQAIVIVRVP